ncbi:hypothetical protein DPMN_020666 [Dreissena polymorpha]|uniref:Uncharacterized protein n=1 Tax=Dreissena polymorpha TaxID=45954 RepID=A0A9D4NKI1_DREPO|nr:hypothetical protein DPMN_019102 [Dreissena polymorpha]KAH3896489.1 hypothetical protein DPMN_020666 [Dreissena polymorpha]
MLIGQLPCDLNADLTNIDRRFDKFGGWENRGGVYLKLPVAQSRLRQYIGKLSQTLTSRKPDVNKFL